MQSPFVRIRDVVRPEALEGMPADYAKSGVALLPGVHEVNQDMVIDEPVMFWGGILQPQAGVDVALNGPVQAPSRQIFDLSVGGIISGTPQVETASVTWWGADPSGQSFSADAINAAIAFCLGGYKPMLTHPAGHYLCDKRIIKTQSFYVPIISGTGGGTDGSPGGTSWDFSQADIGADANGEPDACVVIRGGSGQTSHGGIKDIEIVGNGRCTGLAVSDQCGIYVQNMIVRNVVDGFLFHNETGFTEWNKLIGCQVHRPSRYAINFRRSKGGDSFHGIELLDCWTNLSTTSPGAVHVGANGKWYNGTARLRVFFAGGLTNWQDAFITEGGSYDVDLEGYIKMEGGNGWARGATGPRWVNFAGPVLGNTGFTWGGLRQIRHLMNCGPEGGNAIVAFSEYFSHGPRAVTMNANGEFDCGLRIAGAQDLELLVACSHYEYRISGIARQQGYGGEGNFQPTSVWALNNGRGFGEPIFRVGADHMLYLRNDKYPPGEVKFYVWGTQRSLLVQSAGRFATMNL